MGFSLKNVAKIVGGGAINPVLGSIGLINTATSGDPSGISKDSYGFQMPPEIDPRLEQIRSKQFGLAQKFKEDTPGLMNRTFTQAEDETKMSLDDKRRDIAKGAASRGLLYSGFKPAAEQQAGAEAAGELVGRRRKIADSFEEQQAQMDQAAFDSGSKLQELKQARYDSIYKRQLAAQQQQAQDMTSPLGILGAPFRMFG